MGVSLQELSFGVGMAAVTNPVQSVLYNILHIRTVRIMAGIAFLLDKRRMRNLRFLRFLSFAVTGKTQLSDFHIQKIFVFGGVGGMTGKAGFLTRVWRMVERNLLTFFLMAIKAEGANLFEEKLRVLRRMGLMAGVTCPLFEREVVNLSARPQLRGVVTIIAKLTSGFRRPKRFRIRRGFMARIALG